MTKKRFVIGVLLLGSLLAISCDTFFSSSWGTSREYDVSKIDINSDNVDSWLESASGNSKLAETLTEKIRQQLKGKVKQGSPTKEQAILQQAGTKLAVESAKIGETIISVATGTITNLNTGNVQGFVDLLGKVQSDFRANNGTKAASNLSEIVSGSLDKKPGDYQVGEAPSFPKDNEFAKISESGEVGKAVVLLVLAITDQKDIDDVKLDKLDQQGIAIDPNNGKALVAHNATPESVALAAYLNLIADDTTGKYDKNPITSSIKSAFGVGKNQKVVKY